jgi:hypothetical protein
MNSSPHPGDFLTIVFLLIGLAFVALFLGIFVWSLVWVYGDAERRGKSGCLITLLVFLVSWPLGLLIWLCARPERKR